MYTYEFHRWEIRAHYVPINRSRRQLGFMKEERFLKSSTVSANTQSKKLCSNLTTIDPRFKGWATRVAALSQRTVWGRNAADANSGATDLWWRCAGRHQGASSVAATRRALTASGSTGIASTGSGQFGIVLREVFLHFRDDVLAVSELSECWHMWTNTMHKNLSLSRVRNVEHFLDDIIRILIFHHGIKRRIHHVFTVVENFTDQHLSFRPRSVSHCLFNNIAGEFMLTENKDFSTENRYDFPFVFGFAMLQNMLQRNRWLKNTKNWTNEGITSHTQIHVELCEIRYLRANMRDMYRLWDPLNTQQHMGTIRVEQIVFFAKQGNMSHPVILETISLIGSSSESLLILVFVSNDSSFKENKIFLKSISKVYYKSYRKSEAVFQFTSL